MPYFLKRVLKLIPVLLGISFFTFFLLYLAPGDPAETKLSAGGIAYSNELLEKTREEMGLNQSIPTQYINWLSNAIKGDLGKSYIDGLSVFDKLSKAMPYTISLAFNSIIISVVVSIPLGILTALYKDKLPDNIIRFFTFIGNAIPDFILALILIYFFSIKLKILPVIASKSYKGLIMPTLSLAIVMSSKYIRQIRSLVSEELEKDYVMALRAKGIKNSTILFKNVLKNCMVTIITLVGLSLGSLLGGTAIIENIYVWPGIGRLVVEAILKRDYPVVQGFVIWIAIIYVLINIVIDLSYPLFDPRAKVTRGGRNE